MKKWQITGLLKTLSLFIVLFLVSNERAQAEKVNLNIKFVGQNILVKDIADVEAYLVSSTSNPFCIQYGINQYVGLPYINNLKETPLKVTSSGENLYNISGAVNSGLCLYSISKIWVFFMNMVSSFF